MRDDGVLGVTALRPCLHDIGLVNSAEQGQVNVWRPVRLRCMRLNDLVQYVRVLHPVASIHRDALSPRGYRSAWSTAMSSGRTAAMVLSLPCKAVFSTSSASI